MQLDVLRLHEMFSLSSMCIRLSCFLCRLEVVMKLVHIWLGSSSDTCLFLMLLRKSLRLMTKLYCPFGRRFSPLSILLSSKLSLSF